MLLYLVVVVAVLFDRADRIERYALGVKFGKQLLDGFRAGF
jgi:hypothetical protein